MMQCFFPAAFQKRLAPLLLFFGLLANSARADQKDLPTNTRSITWPEIVTTVDRHPRITASRIDVDAAQASVKAAGAIPNPELEGMLARGVDREQGTARLEWGLSLTVPLGWLSQRGKSMDAAQAGVDLARAEAKALRRDILLELRTLFWTLAYEQSRLASLQSLEAHTSAMATAIERRVEKGEVRPIEAIRVQIELEKLKTEVELARASFASRQRELALWLGIPSEHALSPAVDIESLPRIVGRDAALSSARATHPSIQVARAKTRAMQAEISMEKTARFPSWAITGFTAHELDRVAHGAELTVELPLWNWNSGRIEQAKARLAAAQQQEQADKIALESMVLEAQGTCEASVTSATRMKQIVLPRSESAAAIMEKTHAVGEASLLEVIDARRTLVDARAQYLSALAQAHINCSRLSILMGEEAQ